MALTKTEREEIIGNIKKIEKYQTLKPWPHKRNVLISETGEVVIFNSTKSKSQCKGNFQEILSDAEVWNYINNFQYGSYWVVIPVNGQFMYYRTDIKTIIFNRIKEKKGKDANRYLIRVLTDNAENGSKYLKIIGGNSNTDLFIMTLINVNSFNYEEPCYVYLMTDNNNGYTKIGISNNPLYRENTLQSEKPSIILRKKLQFSSRNKRESLKKNCTNNIKTYVLGVSGTI